MIIAHRGGKPENSLEAFAKTTKNPLIDGIEFDVRLTSDNDFIVLHDNNIDGVCIETLTLSEIHKINPDIPTLQDTLDIIKMASATHYNDDRNCIPLINIEIKTFDTCEVLAHWLSKYIDENNDVFQPENFIATSFLHSEIVKMHDIFPNIHYGWILRCWPTNFHKTLNDFPFIETLIVSEHCIHVESLKMLKTNLENKLAIWVYTINNFDKANFLISLVGVDGIITDTPDEILQELLTIYPSNN
jgi:glycerophosphoryl diester phosphodiesterase